MENNLMIFENEAFGKVRTLNLNGEPWFVAVDVCSVLDLSNPTIAVSAQRGGIARRTAERP